MKCPCCNSILRIVNISTLELTTGHQIEQRWPEWSVDNPLLECGTCECSMLKSDWVKLAKSQRGLPKGDR